MEYKKIEAEYDEECEGWTATIVEGSDYYQACKSMRHEEMGGELVFLTADDLINVANNMGITEVIFNSPE